MEDCSSYHTPHHHLVHEVDLECCANAGAFLCFTLPPSLSTTVKRNFIEGDSVLVSDMQGWWAVVFASLNKVIVNTKQNEVLVFLYASSSSVIANNNLILNHKYRIDRYKSFDTNTYLVNNLTTFVSHKQAKVSLSSSMETFFSQRGLTQDTNNTSMTFPSLYRLREILVDGSLPRVSSLLKTVDHVIDLVCHSMEHSPANLTLLQIVSNQIRTCNTDQLQAILLCFNSQDLCVIQGLPGTGKTQVISIVVILLVLMKQRVLISSHTHTAIDNILLRLLPYRTFSAIAC